MKQMKINNEADIWGLKATCKMRNSCEKPFDLCPYRHECVRYLDTKRDCLTPNNEPFENLRDFYLGNSEEIIKNHHFNSGGKYKQKDRHYKKWFNMLDCAKRRNIEVCGCWLDYQNFALFLDMNNLLNIKYRWKKDVKILDKNAIIY